jgi:methionyl-tRNA formyltransferase
MKKYSVIIFGCRTNTLELLKSLDKNKFLIKKIITISSSTAKKNNVSGYFNLKKKKEFKSKTIVSKKYNLKDKSILKFFKNNKNYLGISIGWQRIIPNEILESFSFGILGMHCSYLDLPNGKGRSPVIWSMLKGFAYLKVHIFKYISKFDEGPLVYKKKINILQFENIDDIQKKLALIFSNFLNNENFHKIKKKNFKNNIKNITFKKRDEDSGKIILKNHSCKSFCNFVNAQTNPYPGAYFLINGLKFKVYQALPFHHDNDFILNKKMKYHIFSDKSFIFRLKNKYVYIKKHGIKKNFLNNEFFNKIFV